MNEDLGHQELDNVEPLNPWFSIWLQPRATMQQILDTDPTRLVLLLVLLTGFSHALNNAAVDNVGDKVDSWHAVVVACAIGGPISGILGLFLGGYLLRKTGSWLGGTANQREVRAAIGWGGVPSIWLGLLWIPSIGLFGDDNFTSATPRVNDDPMLASVLLFLGLVRLLGSSWSIVIWLKCLGQVHKFSAWRALGSVLLMALVLVVPVFLLILLAGGW